MHSNFAVRLGGGEEMKKLPEGLIHHCACGRRHTSYVYQDLLKRYGMRAIIHFDEKKINCEQIIWIP